MIFYSASKETTFFAASSTTTVSKSPAKPTWVPLPKATARCLKEKNRSTGCGGHGVFMVGSYIVRPTVQKACCGSVTHQRFPTIILVAVAFDWGINQNNQVRPHGGQLFRNLNSRLVSTGCRSSHQSICVI